MLLHLTTCLLDKAVDILIDLSRGGGGRGETAFMYLGIERGKIEKIRKYKLESDTEKVIGRFVNEYFFGLVTYS